MTDYDPAEVASFGPHGIRVISGGSGLKELAQASADERRRLLDKLRSYYDEFNFVIIDTSPGIGDEVVDFLRDADDILLVTTTEPTSLRDTYAVAKTLDREASELDITLVINDCSSHEQASNAVSVLNDVSAKFLGRRYEYWQHIDSDVLVGRSIHNRRALADAFPRSSVISSLRILVRALQKRRDDATASVCLEEGC
jgi:flagellar biosynthesis protein FlhG